MVAWKKIAINSSHFTSSFPGGAVVKNLPANAGDKRDIGLIPGSGRSPGEGNGNPLQYSCLENLAGLVYGSQRVGHDLATEHTCIFVTRILN